MSVARQLTQKTRIEMIPALFMPKHEKPKLYRQSQLDASTRQKSVLKNTTPAALKLGSQIAQALQKTVAMGLSFFNKWIFRRAELNTQGRTLQFKRFDKATFKIALVRGGNLL